MTTAPKGFSFAVAAAGFKRAERYDLAAVVSDRPATIAGVFTTNKFQAAPVLVCKELLAGSRTARAVVDSTLAATARAGFRVDEITVAGRDRTPMEQLAAALGTTHGSPILAIDIAEVKERLEALPTVRLAAVERRLPGAMHIAIVERQPVAIWQNGGEHVLVDKNGQVIPGPVAGHESLPLVVGDGAGRRADEVLALLDSEPALAARVKAAVLVSGRRWNVMLDDARAGLEVRLPEEGAEAAWHRMAELERGERLSERQVRMVDLRVADRTVLRAERAAAPADAARRKDNGD